MSYKCRMCGLNEVDSQGGICEFCQNGQDPYAAGLSGATPHRSVMVNMNNSSNQDSYAPKHNTGRKILINGGGSIANSDPYGNDMTPSPMPPSVLQNSVGQTSQISTSTNNTVSKQHKKKTKNSNGQMAVSKNSAAMPITNGITKNISTDTPKTSILRKLCRSLFKGVPFPLDDDITMFQIFPDYSGTALNAMGNACDQVIIYGRMNPGAVCENNDIEVYGHRDSSNNIIATKIINKASGTTVKPIRTIPVALIWVLTLLVLSILIPLLVALGPVGLVWGVIIILCLTNLPLAFKIISVIFGAIFSIIKWVSNSLK